ncbi:hypothetical protein [Sphingomonas sp.]|uniref:hypothetical protein n=1 Tax=Sphingomonas sp. TaxID=28214 RepID=UPI002FDA88BA
MFILWQWTRDAWRAFNAVISVFIIAQGNPAERFALVPPVIYGDMHVSHYEE